VHALTGTDTDVDAQVQALTKALAHANTLGTARTHPHPPYNPDSPAHSTLFLTISLLPSLLRIDCTQGGIVELQDQHAQPPDVQTVLFDPANHLSFWPRAFENSKAGLIGGFLNVANVGAFSRSVAKGFELMAYVPTRDTGAFAHDGVHFPSRGEGGDDGSGAGVGAAARSACAYTTPLANSYIPDYPSGGGGHHNDLASAQAACDATLDCGGVTLRSG
jgi:hypothetical protein